MNESYFLASRCVGVLLLLKKEGTYSCNYILGKFYMHVGRFHCTGFCIVSFPFHEEKCLLYLLYEVHTYMSTDVVSMSPFPCHGINCVLLFVNLFVMYFLGTCHVAGWAVSHVCVFETTLCACMPKLTFVVLFVWKN